MERGLYILSDFEAIAALMLDSRFRSANYKLFSYSLRHKGKFSGLDRTVLLRTPSPQLIERQFWHPFALDALEGGNSSGGIEVEGIVSPHGNFAMNC